MYWEFLDGKIIVRDAKFVHIFTFEFRFYDDGDNMYVCVSPDDKAILHDVGNSYEWCAFFEDMDEDEGYVRWEEKNPVSSFPFGSLNHYSHELMKTVMPFVGGPKSW